MIENVIIELLDEYTAFKVMTLEYELLTDKIKEYVKKNNGYVVLDYYSLTLKSVDKSFYSNRLIPYLKTNNLTKFIVEKVNEDKINKLVENKIIEESDVLKNIVSEKTFLNIQLLNFDKNLKNIELQLSQNIHQMSMKRCVDKRESLRIEIDKSRFKYFTLAKQVKDLLSIGERTMYRFQYNDDLGMLKIKTVSRDYTSSFIQFLKDKNPDSLFYSIDSPSFLNSKNKKIDRNITEQFKIEDYKDYLYIKILKGVLDKKIKKMKYSN